MRKPSHRPGVHTTHPVVDVGCVFGEMELRHLLGQRRGQRGLGVILLLEFQLAGGDLLQRRDQCFGTDSADAVKQLTAGLLGVDVNRLDHQHVTSVQPFVQLHDGNAGPGVTVEHRPLDRCRAAVFG